MNMKIKPVLLLFPVLALSACVGGRQPSLSGPDAGGGKSKNTQAVDKTPVDVTPPDASLLAHPTKPTPESAAKLIRYTYKKGELKSLCDAAIQRTKDALAKIAATPIGEVTFDNSMLAFEAVNADFVDDTGMYGFMKYVSTDKTIQGEGADCETAAGQYQVEIFTDRKMYAVLKAAQPRNAAEKRLAFETLLSFEQSGMSLNDGDLAKYKELSQQLTKLQADYSNNLNLDKSHVDFAPEELAGVPQAFVDAHKKTPDGKITIFATESDYPVVMDNASNEQTRLKMMKSYLTRGGDTNLKLLSDAVVLREQIAKLLLANDSSAADQTWVTYRVKQRMVKTRQTVVDFLDGLRGKLAEGNQKDFAQLLAYKKTIDKNATELNAWDIRYMTNQLKKQSFSVDGEAIRQYFPADVVIQGLFGVYSQMLGVDYKEVPNAKVWADGVKLYEIRDHADNRHIGFFYTDFYPRPDTGKYNHAAAFPIFAGRMLPGGYYDFPVSCIVANISPPVNGQPALLSHDDVETIFHEFGHVMHQTLTRAPYASLAGSAVAQDFVEAPSQMLENWVWQPEILKRLSGLASDHSQHLPIRWPNEAGNCCPSTIGCPMICT